MHLRILSYLPSIGFLIFLAIELSIFGDTTWLVDEGATGRHLRIAEIIYQTGAIPTTNPLGLPIPWVDFEWSFEATLGVLLHYFGLVGPTSYCFALFSTAMLLMWRMLAREDLDILPMTLVYIGVLCVVSLQFLMRPLLYTWLFMALLLNIWYAQRTPSVKEWVIFPLVFIFWANTHAGWLAGILFLSASIFGRILDNPRERSSYSWAFLTGCCFLVTLINPVGWHMWKLLAEMMTSKSTFLWYEYQPPDFAKLTCTACITLLIIFVSFIGRIKGKARWTWEVGLPLLIFLYFSLKSQRHVLLLSMIAAVPMAYDLQSILGLTPNKLIQKWCSPKSWEGIVAAIVIGLISIIYIWKGIPPTMSPDIKPTEVQLVSTHKELFQHPLTTATNSGPLLWTFRPYFKVTFDDRGEMYGDNYVLHRLGLEGLWPGWQETLTNGHFDSAFLSPKMPLTSILGSLPGWTEVYRNSDVVIFEHHD